MKFNLYSIGKLALNLAKNMVADVVIQKVRELIAIAEKSGVRGEDKRRMVMRELRTTPGEVSKQFETLPAYLQNLLLESLLAESLSRLKVN